MSDRIQVVPMPYKVMEELCIFIPLFEPNGYALETLGGFPFQQNIYFLSFQLREVFTMSPSFIAHCIYPMEIGNISFNL